MQLDFAVCHLKFTKGRIFLSEFAVNRGVVKIYKELRPPGANLPAEVPKVEMVALIMLCIGSALGLRFRIFVLLPAILLGLFVCTARGPAQGTTIWSITLTNVIGATRLQFGYLRGALLKFLIFAGRFDGTKSSKSARPFAHSRLLTSF